MIVQNLSIKKKDISKNKCAKCAKISQAQSSFHQVHEIQRYLILLMEHLLIIDVTDIIYFYKKKIYILCHGTKKLCKFFKLLS